MERANANSGGRKRTRDQGVVDKEARKGKKPEIYEPAPKEQKNHGHDQLCEGFGVFDFPWLKEGVVFKAEEYFDLESTFPGVLASNFDQCCDQENNTTLVGGISSCYREEKKCEDDGVWPFGDHDQIDGFEPIDRILSLVIDQPATAAMLDSTIHN